jgi:Fe/S biogenesis protein NfuA
VGWFGRKRQADTPREASSREKEPQPRAPETRPAELETEPRVAFTPAAHQQLAAVLGRQAEPAALRILVKNPDAGALSGAPQYDMALEPANTRRPGDTVIDADGLHVIVDGLSLPFVDGATIRFSDDPLQPGFLVEPPRVAGVSSDIPSTFDASDPLAIQVASVLTHHVNPSIASHGGHAELVGVKDDVVYVALGGGCQGCSMASVTLKQGIEQILKQAIPTIRAVIDATDHALGSNPFYSSDKGGESPLHNHAHA